MGFFSKDKKEELPKHPDLGRNDPCHCGSGKKYKKCHSDKDAADEHKVIESNWAKSEAEAKAQAEKEAKENKDSKDTPATPQNKHANPAQNTQQKHQKFVPSQVSTPRKSGGG